MPSRIEDYALIGDCETCALVGRDGSIDWLCFPRFDSPACFAALLGTPEHGRWLLAPAGEVKAIRRRYRPGTLVLETEFETADGVVTVTDFMPGRGRLPNLVRIVEGKRGRVPMRTELVMRFDYGSIDPWVQAVEGGIWAVAGPDSLRLRVPVPLKYVDQMTTAEFEVAAGERIPFVLTWHPSHEPAPAPIDADEALRGSTAWWEEWSGKCTYRGPHREAVVRSLITLKGLTYAPTGGIVAAATTSLPEQLGGVRNWDYRFCWLRDATFTLLSLLKNGYTEEAAAWRAWLLRAVAGRPAAANIMYGLAGERRLTELELDWLPGYEGAKPVRTGNAASRQFQLDVYGEVLDALYQSRKLGLAPNQASGWRLEQALLDFTEEACGRPDEGIWEVRGPKRHFTHSKVMAWVALDRGVRCVEEFGLTGPVNDWRGLRDKLHGQICTEGFNPRLNAFVQSYGSDKLDASLLMIPMVAFLPGDDPRVVGTIAAIEKGLMRDGFVDRYDTRGGEDGLPPGEGAFLVCTFWLADCYYLMGRRKDAQATFERLLALRNDVGLLAEEYDPVAKRLVGNFPQAFSHVGLVNTAMNLSPVDEGAAEERPKKEGEAHAGEREG
jgi:GH15 family glucan-1,4-alpha-glucosidase